MPSTRETFSEVLTKKSTFRPAGKMPWQGNAVRAPQGSPDSERDAETHGLIVSKPQWWRKRFKSLGLASRRSDPVDIWNNSKPCFRFEMGRDSEAQSVDCVGFTFAQSSSTPASNVLDLLFPGSACASYSISCVPENTCLLVICS